MNSDRFSLVSIIDDWTFFKIIIAAILMIWVFFATPLGIYFLLDSEGSGKLGDTFGVLNSLFSSLALAGLLFTIHLQKKELAATRAEFSQQNETLKLQRFESTFFNLLQSQIELIKLIDLRDRDGKIVSSGRDCFKTYRKQLDRLLNSFIAAEMRRRQEIPPAFRTSDNELAALYRKHVKVPLDETLVKYLVVYKIHQADLGHYFRNLYHIIRLIDDSIEINDKKKYVRFVRAQLSANELVMLFYNCLTINGNEKFKPLIEKYQLFKNLNWSLLVNEQHVSAYNQSAYGMDLTEE